MVQPTTASQTPLKAWGLLVFLAVIWGTSFILTKKALHTYSSTEVAAGRLFISTLFFLPFLIRTYKQIPKDRYPYLFFSAMTGYTVPAFLFAIAGAHLNSSLSGMLNSLSPLFTLVIGGLFFAQKTRSNQVFGIIIGLLGAMLLVFAQATGKLSLSDPYALLPLVATLLYGININIITKYLSHLPAIAMAACTFVFIGPITFGILLFTDFFTKVVNSNNLQDTMYLVILGGMSSGLAAVVFNRVVQLSSGLFASSVTYLIPIVAIVWGIFDGENILSQQFIGMAVILTGIYLVNKK
jgi:drug/metabolite transporter (DMT)-like permease